MRFYALLLAAIICVLEGPVPGAEPLKSAPPADALGQAFDKLKALAGEWEIIPVSKEIPAGTVNYRLIGGGSTVMETLFCGSGMEMVSMYHRDGKELVMTHYCCAGNQPRFKARLDDKTGDLVFDFAGGANLDVAKDFHIHEGRIHFVDKDSVSSEWIYYADGKKAGAHALKLKRKQ
jgi:hypothetical protein